jgi:hypothetical protein
VERQRKGCYLQLEIRSFSGWITRGQVCKEDALVLHRAMLTEDFGAFGPCYVGDSDALNENVDKCVAVRLLF